MTAETKAQTLAFPGAEGYAATTTTGGRGGVVRHVTTLDDVSNTTTVGTLRWAVNGSAKKTVVFDVSGTIQLKSALKIGANTTIAGQTAPGDGICIGGAQVTLQQNNIVRFIRFRPGDQGVSGEWDGLGAMDSQNIIVDHCSVSWSVDECLSVYGSTNITVQWCIASQSLNSSNHSKGNHGYGGNWGGNGASYHHNLIAHHVSRTPRLGPRPGTQDKELMDMRNNVIYNWTGNGCYGGEGMKVNIVNNYYKHGPGTPTKTKGKRIAAMGIRTVDYCLNKETTAANINKALGTIYSKDNISGTGTQTGNYVKFGGNSYEIDMTANTITVDGNTIKVVWNDWKKMLHVWGQLYVEGNVNTEYSDVTSDNWTNGIYNQISNGSSVDYTWDQNNKDNMRLLGPLRFEPTTTHTAEDAYERVLQYAGASLHRDALDETIVSDARNATATYGTKGIVNTVEEAGGFPTLNSTEALPDTDQDGIPDEWEDAHGLDKNDANDGKAITDSGYSNLEIYINSLVQDIVDAGNQGGTVKSSDGSQAVTALRHVVTREPIAARQENIYNIQGLVIKSNAAPGDLNSLKRGIYIYRNRKYVVE